MKKHNKNQKRQYVEQGRKAHTVNVDLIYDKIRAEIAYRVRLQDEMHETWRVIKRTHRDHSEKMSRITTEIGASTHRINQLIAELTKHKKVHKAMNVAHDYLGNEISRINKIIADKEQSIRLVRNGYKNLIRDNGKVHNDVTGLVQYVRTKRQQVEKLTKWKSYVRQYLA